jgi:hypothetical protein
MTTPLGDKFNGVDEIFRPGYRNGPLRPREVTLNLQLGLHFSPARHIHCQVPHAHTPSTSEHSLLPFPSNIAVNVTTYGLGRTTRRVCLFFV